MDRKALSERSGPRPRTTPTNPHTQLEQNPDRAAGEGLARRVFALPDVEERPSEISVPGARALWLRKEVPAGPREAFMIGREFAHTALVITIEPVCRSRSVRRSLARLLG